MTAQPNAAPHPARSISLECEADVLARAEAFAASRGLTIEALLRHHIADVGDGLTAACLPRGACMQFLRMFRHNGRDTTARYLADGDWDEFEQPIPAHIYSWVRSHPGLVIDGGANTGFYSLLAAAAAPGVQVLAFEPEPSVYNLLRANIDANGLAGRITAHEAALSDTAGRGSLYVPSQDHGMIETSSSMEHDFKARLSDVIEVETTTVDAAVAAHGTGAGVSLIKLDIAGHEWAALHGAAATVAAHRPLIIVELLEHAEVGHMSRFVREHGYLDVPFRMKGALHPQLIVTFESDAWNHALVPAERLPAFLTAPRLES